MQQSPAVEPTRRDGLVDSNVSPSEKSGLLDMDMIEQTDEPTKIWPMHMLQPNPTPGGHQAGPGADVEPSHAPLAKGTKSTLTRKIGKYELKSKLARGAFGVVFIAHDPSLDRDVAIKVLRPNHLTNEVIFQRFLAEARATARIAHPGIVTIHDCGQIDTNLGTTAYIAMELLAGESLGDRLANHGRLSPEAAMEIVRQVASALEAAHRSDVLHRDLKPDNVYLVPDPAMPAGERVKVFDFGLAKLGDQNHTRVDIVFGTPHYMSPEQTRSAAQVDHRSDIYALGCILFELVTGATPFDGALREIVDHHQKALAPRVSTIIPDISPELDQLIAHMLAKDPMARPQTMGAVQRELQRILASAQAEPPTAAPSGVPRAPSTSHLSPLPGRLPGARVEPQSEALVYIPPALTPPPELEAALQEPMQGHPPVPRAHPPTPPPVVRAHPPTPPPPRAHPPTPAPPQPYRDHPSQPHAAPQQPYRDHPSQPHAVPQQPYRDHPSQPYVVPQPYALQPPAQPPLYEPPATHQPYEHQPYGQPAHAQPTVVAYGQPPAPPAFAQQPAYPPPSYPQPPPPPYAAPPQGYAQPPTYAAPTQQPYAPSPASPPQGYAQQPYAHPPTQQPYAHPPTQQPYAHPPTQQPYAHPPTQQPYAQPAHGPSQGSAPHPLLTAPGQPSVQTPSLFPPGPPPTMASSAAATVAAAAAPAPIAAPIPPAASDDDAFSAGQVSGVLVVPPSANRPAEQEEREPREAKGGKGGKGGKDAKGGKGGKGSKDAKKPRDAREAKAPKASGDEPKNAKKGKDARNPVVRPEAPRSLASTFVIAGLGVLVIVIAIVLALVTAG
jgi:serine/threonine protein kinase